MNHRSPESPLCRTLAVVLPTLLTLWCGGCVSFSTRLASSALPDSDAAYVYGTFVKEGNYDFALVIKGGSMKSTHVIRYGTSAQPVMIQLPPGEYRMQHVACLPPNGKSPIGTLSIPKGIWPEVYKQPFTVEARKAYYLGHYFGRYTKRTLEHDNIAGFLVPFPEDEFEATTHLVKKRYSNFSSISCVKLFDPPEDMYDPAMSTFPDSLRNSESSE